MALLGVLVRRRAHGCVGHEHLVQGGRVCAAGVDAHGQIGHDAQPHARGQGAFLRDAALLVGDELQPHVKLHQVLRVFAGVLWCAVVFRLGGLRRAPLRELLEPFALV